MKYILIILMFITQGVMAQTVVEGPASVKKINWQDGKRIDQIKYPHNTKFGINEEDSTLLVGSEGLIIREIIATDSVITYVTDNVDKEYVYDRESTLTQKNIKWRSHGIETWFVYELIENKNEFEL